ncbi:hypothetical protein LJK88_49820 [Paenibacillus sp. P26]|nr:hypothetical protein LJK88_49820 [Paenibacillus sp. P26]
MVTIMGTLKPPEGPVVQHMLIAGSSSAAGLEGGESVLPKPFLEAVEQDAQKQQTAVQKYTKEIGNKTLFYVISKERLEDKPGYMVSYAWGNYRDDLVMTMFVRLMLLMVGLIVFSWSALRLVRPLLVPPAGADGAACRKNGRTGLARSARNGPARRNRPPGVGD